MVKPAPKLDPRTAAEIARQVQGLLHDYAPEWTEFEIDPATGSPRLDPATQAPLPNPMNTALLGVFSRFAETIIQRLNQVPDKSFLAFLNLLGASRLPPQPARVPLTFTLAPGSTVGVVPTGTQVAAPPGLGESDPVVYETESELVVTAAQLVAAIAEDLGIDRYHDHRSLLDLAGDRATALFHCDHPIEHSFYLTHADQFSITDLKALRLQFTLVAPISAPRDDRTLVWEFFDGDRFVALVPTTDTTQQLTRSGEVVFGDSNLQRNSVPLPAIKPVAVVGQLQPWLRCRLLTPITADRLPRSGMIRTAQLPSLSEIQTQVAVRRTGLRPDAAFANQTALDLNKALLPFGDKPKLGDVFYLACQEGFAQAQTSLTLTMTVLNARTLATAPAGLRWEFWEGQTWRAVTGTVDGTVAFTRSGTITFTLPNQPPPQRLTLNGLEAYWVRAKIISGDYGQEATYLPRSTNDGQGRQIQVYDDQGRQIIDFTQANFVPPIIDTLTLDYGFITPAVAPDAVLTDNHQTYRAISPSTQAPVQPFQGSDGGDRPALYLGLQLPPGISLQNQPLSLFLQAAAVPYGERESPIAPSQSYALGDPRTTVSHLLWFTNPTEQSLDYGLTFLGQKWDINPTLTAFTLAPGSSRSLEIEVTIPDQAPNDGVDRALLLLTSDQGDQAIATLETRVANAETKAQRPQLSWQYWNGDQWASLTLQDGTTHLTRTGLVKFFPPLNWLPKDQFGQTALYWLRVVWESGTYLTPARLQRVLTNTTTATQTITLRNEILGSSDGTENQRFPALQAPILDGQRLDVREANVLPVLSSPDPASSVWVPWQEVPDFYGSGPQDRHYVLNHLTGEVQFGNGLNGRIPPLGNGNLRLTHYQTGGGQRGNRPVGAITQLKTTIPYVKQVTNVAPAVAGAEAETLESLKERAPRTIRHGDRAVTLEDFEDLARLASPAVARARCVPLVNLAANPLAPPDQPPSLGEISVIIVPTTTDLQPIPSLELIDRVQRYLNTRALPTVNLSVVGPLYIRVSVTVEVVPTTLELAGAVEQAIQQTLTHFLHPLTGGPNGTGWEFGRRPQRSDLYALLEAIPGVDHLRQLTIDPDDSPSPDIQAILNTQRFLVYSGTHTLYLTA